VFSTGGSVYRFFTLKMEAICSSETSVHTKLNGATSQKTALFKYKVDYKFCRLSSHPPNYSMDQSPSEKLTVIQPRNSLPFKEPKKVKGKVKLSLCLTT
jgi:hypothetical protein